MWLRLAVVFAVIPVIELALVIEIGRRIGTGPTVALVIITGMVGAFLAQSQGLGVVRSLRGDLQEGRVPAEGLFSGVLVLAGGILLVTPGFLTDLVGFAFLIPWSRRALLAWLRQKVRVWMERGTLRIYDLR